MTSFTEETVLIRTAEPHEYAATGDLVARVYLDDGLLTFGEEDPYLPVLRDAATTAAQAVLLVAVDTDGALLGTVTYAPQGSPMQDIGAAGEAEFRMLAVLPQARGRGVGESLVQACVTRAKAEEGVRRLVLSTSDEMPGAHRIYERTGFVRTPERDWSPLADVSLLTYKLEL